MKGEKPFARETHGGFEKGGEKGRQREPGCRRERMNCRTCGSWRTERGFVGDRMSWTALETELYKLFRNISADTVF